MMRVVLVALLAAGASLAAGACSSRRSSAVSAKGEGVDCNSTVGAVACPPDGKDPLGKGLPKQGGACKLPSCKPCGSSSALAFRDATGAARAGYCMCVPKSDDSGDATYTCFTAEDWARRAP